MNEPHVTHLLQAERELLAECHRWQLYLALCGEELPVSELESSLCEPGCERMVTYCQKCLHDAAQRGCRRVRVRRHLMPGRPSVERLSPLPAPGGRSASISCTGPCFPLAVRVQALLVGAQAAAARRRFGGRSALVISDAVVVALDANIRVKERVGGGVTAAA